MAIVEELKIALHDYSLQSDTDHNGTDWTLAHSGSEVFCRGGMSADDLMEMGELLVAAARWLETRK
jgi:hypothetical protein